MADVTLDDLGVPQRSVAVVDAAHVERIAATFDAPPPSAGDPLPALWHWAFFTPTTSTAGLGTDGHPVLTSPALAAFPRRMWGAGRVEWEHDLRVGEPAERASAVRSSREVTGGSGALLIVSLEHEYHQGGVRCVREQQSLVYRDPPADPVPLPADGPPVEVPAGSWAEEQRPAPPLLFRFSAITFNSHRIHYDLPYVRDVEGYPGLVVQGPLTALTLATFAERCTGRRLAAFEFKATAPMFAGLRSTFVCAPPDPETSSGGAHVLRNDGTVAMQAEYRLRD
jgi:itaconyl-CoA hydratase/mesaconyl-C4 CoA hydratase